MQQPERTASRRTTASAQPWASMIAATIAAALRVTSRIPRRHRTAFAVGCGGAGASSALLVTGSARAAPSSGGLAAVKGQSEPPLVSGKPRTPSAANPFVTTVWAYATEADRRASINPEKYERSTAAFAS
eukprot:SAG31_NODE_944_length_10844_cov_11.214053_10_plen_130_part_00